MKFFIFCVFYFIISFIICDLTDIDLGTYSPDLSILNFFNMHNSIIVDASELFVVFNSKDFKVDETLHFKIKVLDQEDTFLKEGVDYEFLKSFDDFSGSFNNSAPFETKKSREKNNNVKYITRYFNIKKKAENADGNYLVIAFYVKEGMVEISNTEKDESEIKFKTWVIIVIVVAVVVVIGVGILLYCIKRKRELRDNLRVKGINVKQTQNARLYHTKNSNYNNDIESDRNFQQSNQVNVVPFGFNNGKPY